MTEKHPLLEATERYLEITEADKAKGKSCYTMHEACERGRVKLQMLWELQRACPGTQVSDLWDETGERRASPLEQAAKSLAWGVEISGAWKSEKGFVPPGVQRHLDKATAQLMDLLKKARPDLAIYGRPYTPEEIERSDLDEEPYL